MTNEVRSIIQKQEKVKTEIFHLKASIAEELNTLTARLKDAQGELDETIAETIKAEPEQVFSNAEFVKEIHHLVYANGAGLPLSSRELQKAVPADLALNVYGGWRTLETESKESAVVLYSPGVRIEKCDSDRKLEATAEWLEGWINAVEEAAPVSEYGRFKIIVTDYSLSERGTLFIEQGSDGWVLKILSYGQESKQHSTSSLLELLVAIREQHHA